MTRQVPRMLVVGALVAALPTAAHMLISDSDSAARTSGETVRQEQPGLAAADRDAASRVRETATAALRLADGTEVGQVRLTSRGLDTRVNVRLDLPEELAVAGGSFHGFHVHANNDPANGAGCAADPAAPASTWFVSADGHYTDPGRPHGEHLGDLPAVYLQRDGRSVATFVTDRFRPADVLGRAVIVHAQPDNFGNVPVGIEPDDYQPNSPAAGTLTTTTGNAGDRVACGIFAP